MSKYLFKSERIGFCLWEESDLGELSKMNMDPEVMKFFPSTQDSVKSAQFISRMQSLYEAHHICFYKTVLLEDDQFIGFVGLNYNEADSPVSPCYEIGWRLKKDHWGKGYATEAAKACLDHGFIDLQMKAIYAWTATVNLPSEAVMLKIGMSKETTFNHPKLAEDHLLAPHFLYGIKRD